MKMRYGLYIHIPFCVQKCPYCGFYSEAGAESFMGAYFQALLTELEGQRIDVDTIYIGGGTPSFAGAHLTDFIAAMLPLINYSGDEFTVELNPESVNNDFCLALKDTPVNRVSMGMQSLSDSVLRLLGRPHDAAQALRAHDMLRKHLSADINLDIIYDIPSVAWNTINDSLNKLINLAPEHISAYSYSPDTGYLSDKTVLSGGFDSLTDDPAQMLQTVVMLEDAGYARYEISNFARAGKASKHNSKYWRMEEYLGLGASAHSMIYQDDRRVRYSHRADLRHYINNPLDKDIEIYEQADMLKESVVFGLRMVDGVKLQTGLESSFLKKIEELIDENLLEQQGERLRCTPKGLLLLNSVMNYLW